MNKAIHFVTKKLKQYREDRDWTQQRMADYLTLQTGQPVSRQNINYWETKKRALTADRALAIHDATGIPIMELVEPKAND